MDCFIYLFIYLFKRVLCIFRCIALFVSYFIAQCITLPKQLLMLCSIYLLVYCLINLCVICSTCLSMLPVIQISMYCFMYLIIWIYVARLLPKLHTTKRKQGITKTIIFSFAEKRYFFEWVVYSREATAERPYLLTYLFLSFILPCFVVVLFLIKSGFTNKRCQGNQNTHLGK